LNARYDSGILYTDRFVGRLKDKIQQLGLLDKTIIIILSDHGEELFHRKYGATHGHSLYDELVRVPLIFYSPALIRPRKIRHFQPSLVDVYPTLLDLVNVKVSNLRVQGKSLAGILMGGDVPGESWAVSEAVDKGPEKKAIRLTRGESKGKFIFTIDQPILTINIPPANPNSRFPNKYKHQALHMRSESGKEFFDLVSDPGEKTNMDARDFFLKEHLQNRMNNYLKSTPKPEKGASVEINRALKEKLESLGYL